MQIDVYCAVEWLYLTIENHCHCEEAKGRRGNLQHRSTRKYVPINIEYLRFTMLIG